MPEPDPYVRAEESVNFLQTIGVTHGSRLPGLESLIWDTLDCTGADVGGLILFDGDREFMAASAGLVWPDEVSCSGLFAHVRAHPRRVTAIGDLRYDARTVDSPFVLAPPFLRGFAAAPVSVQRNVVVGAVAFGWLNAQEFKRETLVYVQSSGVLTAALLKSMTSYKDEYLS